jgi:hypothetical protein
VPRVLVGVAVAVLVAGGLLGAAGAAEAQPASCVARISAFRFRPSTVAQGAATTLTLKVADCTTHAHKVTLTQYGGEPNCVTVDPIARSITVRPKHPYVQTQPWTFTSCAGTLTMTAVVSGSGGAQLAKGTAQLTITP